MAKNQRIPNLGKLSIAILESRVKSLLGDEAIKELKKPYEDKKLQDVLGETLKEAESRFIKEYEDKWICEALINLPIADLPSLQKTLRAFYDHPTNSKLEELLTNQMSADFPSLDANRITKAVKFYLKTLKEELISVDDQVRQKLTAVALLGIHESIQEIARGEDLYRSFSDNAFSKHIRIHEFKTLVNERTRNFIGRDFVINAIDNIIENSGLNSGYIVLYGEPGIGKTALIAQLVKTRGYVHHFNIAPQNIRSIQDFLENLCSQLIVRYQLNYAALPERAAKDSGIFIQLLSESVEKDVAHRIVVLIDALDEADDLGLSPTENKLNLPRVLPDGVFFIVSTREKADSNYRLLVDNREDIYLQDDDPRNMIDVRNYILRFISENQEKMFHCLVQWKVTESQFVETLTQKSQGNFMYLVHVLRDIRDGKLTTENTEDVQSLPLGLKEYYQSHWRMMRSLNKESFEKYQKPVICILATVREPVTIDLISEWTGLGIMDIKDVISEWREFLNEDKTDDSESLFRVYHKSFQDFLEYEVGLKIYHKAIAEHTLRKVKW